MKKMSPLINIVVIIATLRSIHTSESSINTTTPIEVTTEEPFLCPDFDCDSAQCRHFDRSGLCDEVINGTLEITRENCGCCFLCNDSIGK